MAQTIVQTNFTSGELAPEAYGRVDIAKYQNAAKTLRNVIVQVLGGVRGRGGFRFIASTKNSAKRSRLVPYIFSREQAYMLEFGDGYMRVFKDGGQVLAGGSPFEISTPYIEAMLAGIGFVQGADTMFLAHHDTPIHRLRRLDHDDWLLEPAPFVVLPFDEIGHRPPYGLGISDTSVGINRIITAAGNSFLSSDVGRLVVAGGGVAKITAVSSATVATVDVTTAFRDSSLAPFEWTLTGSPQATIKPNKKEPVGDPVTLDAQNTSTTQPSKAITGLVHDGSNTVTVTSPGHGYGNGNTIVISGCLPSTYNGTFSIFGVGADTFRYTLSPSPGPATILGQANRTVNTTPNVWRSEDVGKFVSINGGLVQITQINSQTSAVATIVAVMTADVASQPNAWSLKSSMWNDVDGYPCAVSLYEQRLIAAGSPGFPDYIWLSRTGRPLDFTLGTKDDDAFSVPVYSDQINPVVHLAQTTALIAMTYGGESTVVGGIERPLTYSTAQIKNQSTYGSGQVRPVRIGNQIFFLQRGSLSLRATSFQVDSNGYVAPEISKLSRHLLESPIVAMAHQQSPDSVIWLVREDGKMLTVAVDSSEDVIAWSWHDTDGAFEDVSCIPTANGPDQVWVIVRREVGGEVVRYVELLDDSVHTDSSIAGMSDTPTATWSGFQHLAGRQVLVVADGIPQGEFAVSGAGEITLSTPVSSLQAGLRFNPLVDLLTPEMVGPQGSAQGNNMFTNEVTLLLLNTTGAKVNGEYIDFREFDTPATLDRPASSFSGLARTPLRGWSRGSSDIVIEQDQPLPFYLLAVIRKFTSNG